MQGYPSGINRFVENEIQLHEIVKSLRESVSLSTEVSYPGPPEQREGVQRGCHPPQKKNLSVDAPFFADESYKCPLFERSNQKCT